LSEVSKVIDSAWLFVSRYGTTGKDTNPDIPNPKECSKPILLIIQGPINPLPIPPSPHSPNTPELNMQNGCLGIPYYQQFVEFPIH
jgi:hypothetical protein